MEQISYEEDLFTDAVPSAPREDPEHDKTSSTASQRQSASNKRKNRPSKLHVPQGAHTNISISNSTNVHVGPNIVVNYGHKKPNLYKTADTNNNVRRLFCNTTPLERNHLRFISRHIEESWKEIGRCLGYSEGEIVQFKLDNNELGICEVIFQMLLDWIQNKPDEATVGKLAQVLWECEQQDAVKRWCKEFTDTYL